MRDAALDITVHSGESTPGGNPGRSCLNSWIGPHFLLHTDGRVPQEDCRRQGIAFLPMAAKSFGGWHSEPEHEVKKLGTALASCVDAASDIQICSMVNYHFRIFL